MPSSPARVHAIPLWRMLLVACLGALALACDPAPVEEGCRVNGDCAEGERCVDGRCVAVDGAGDAGRSATDAGRGRDAGGPVDAGPPDAGPPPDRDGDGLSDEEEERLGTNPDLRDTDMDGVLDGDEVAMGSDPLEGDSDGDGIEDGDEVFLGTDPTVEDRACADTEAEATLVSRPVDIIFAIDSSGSMDGEIDAVQRNINENLAAILEAARVDYRVIMVAEYRNTAGADGVCIEAPLGGNPDCTSPYATHTDSTPVDGERFFHYGRKVSSSNSFVVLLETYDGRDADSLHDSTEGWRRWLRPDALRVFVEISDDDSGLPYTDFDDDLLAFSEGYFGTADARNYIWHSIIGMVGREAPDDLVPWEPSDPVFLERCSPGSAGFGEDYQELSRLTGGLRFPLCNNDSFNSVFARIAEDVIVGSRLPCTFVPVTPPGGETPDFERVVTILAPTGEPRRTLERVADADACAAGGDYYVAAGTIELCPALCATVEADEGAALEVHVACEQLCGNDAIDGEEECDDGNRDNEDGCSDRCLLECGNGDREGAEECDDGNRVSMDGCSETCTIELM